MNAPLAPPPFLRILLGPTASAKSAVALHCARELGTDIISVDSMKVYRRLAIGTAKPSEAVRRNVTHHCVDLAAPTERFSVARYVAAAEAACRRLYGVGKRPLLAGGTALYYKGLLEGLFDAPPPDPALREALRERAATQGPEALHRELADKDPAAAEKIHPHDVRRLVRALEVFASTGRPISEQQRQWEGFHAADGTEEGEPPPPPPHASRFRYPCALVGLHWPRQMLYARIDQRADRMMAAGLLEEARWVYEHRATLSPTLLQAVAYKELFGYFEGQQPLADCVELLKKHTRHLAKSQLTWFRKFPCRWVEMSEDRDPEDAAAEALAIWEKAKQEGPAGRIP